MGIHNDTFAEIPVGGTVCRHWATQPTAALDSATAKIVTHGANPWVFCADARHFHQFAGAEDRAALLAMSPAERLALLGEWEGGDWDAFAFDPHRQVRDSAEAEGIAAIAALGR